MNFKNSIEKSASGYNNSSLLPHEILDLIVCYGKETIDIPLLLSLKDDNNCNLLFKYIEKEYQILVKKLLSEGMPLEGNLSQKALQLHWIFHERTGLFKTE